MQTSATPIVTDGSIYISCLLIHSLQCSYTLTLASVEFRVFAVIGLYRRRLAASELEAYATDLSVTCRRQVADFRKTCFKPYSKQVWAW